jgi:hypothetical protein
LILVPLTFAQAGHHQAAVGSQPASENCAFTFSSGSGHGATQYCVTANGNIAQFTMTGLNGLPSEMFSGVAPASEGYGVCDTSTLTSYYDYARNDSGNWNSATSTSTPKSVTVTRTTADGVWKIVQTIMQKKASKMQYGGVEIKMAITNLSQQDRIIIVYRHANIDAYGSPFNDFDASETSAFGFVSGMGGVSSTASLLTTAFDFHFAFLQTNPDGPIPCTPIGNQGGQQTFFQGDGSVTHYFNLEILPRRTKTVTVTYQGI